LFLQKLGPANTLHFLVRDVKKVSAEVQNQATCGFEISSTHQQETDFPPLCQPYISDDLSEKLFVPQTLFREVSVSSERRR